MRVSEEMGAHLVAEQARKTGQGRSRIPPRPKPTKPTFENEDEFTDWIVARAEECGWRAYSLKRTDRAKLRGGTGKGFFDVVLMGASPTNAGQCFFVEAKMDRDGTSTVDQLLWMAVAGCVQDTRAVVWQPKDAEAILGMLGA